jgi:hypothetical protein
MFQMNFPIHSVRLSQLVMRHSEIDKRAQVNLFGKEDTLGWDEEERQMNCFPGKRMRRNLPRRTRRRSASVSPTKSRLYFQTGTAAAAAHERAHTLHCSLVETDSRTHALWRHTYYWHVHCPHERGISPSLSLSTTCLLTCICVALHAHPSNLLLRLCQIFLDYVKYSQITYVKYSKIISRICQIFLDYVKYSQITYVILFKLLEFS